MKSLYLAVTMLELDRILCLCVILDNKLYTYTDQDERRILQSLGSLMEANRDITHIYVDTHISLLYLNERQQKLGVVAIPIEQVRETEQYRRWKRPMFKGDLSWQVYDDFIYMRPIGYVYASLDMLVPIVGPTFGDVYEPHTFPSSRLSQMYPYRRNTVNTPVPKTHRVPLWYTCLDRSEMLMLPDIKFDIHKYASFLGEAIRLPPSKTFSIADAHHPSILATPNTLECNRRATLLQHIIENNLFDQSIPQFGDIENEFASSILTKRMIELYKLSQKISNSPLLFLHLLNGDCKRSVVCAQMCCWYQSQSTENAIQKIGCARFELLKNTISSLMQMEDMYRWVPINVDVFCSRFNIKYPSVDVYVDILHREYLMDGVFFDGTHIWASSDNIVFA